MTSDNQDYSCDPIFLAMSGQHRTNGYEVQAILLSPLRSVDFSVDTWYAWVAGAIPARIKCQRATISQFASSSSSEGKPLTLVDGEPLVSDLGQEIVAASENRVTLVLEMFGDQLRTPFFLSPYKDIKPSTYAVLAEMTVRTLSQVPDVIAYTRFLEHRMKMAIDDVSKASRLMILQTGSILPISVECEHRIIPGGLFLGEKVKDGAFLAELVMCDTIKFSSSGAELGREVCWEEQDIKKRISSTIARVFDEDWRTER